MNALAGWEVEQQEAEKSHICGAKRKATSSAVFVSDGMNPPRKSELTPQPGV
jgi:hypothetical protein